MSNVPSLARISSPNFRPLYVCEVKRYLKIDHNDDDTLIGNLIDTVTNSAEKYLKTSIINQVWELIYDKYVPTIVKLPMGPVQKILNVRCERPDFNGTIISSDVYYLSAQKKKLIFEANILGHRTYITYEAGYGVRGDQVPEAIKQGLLNHISGVYAGKCGSSVIPAKCQELYKPYKELSYA